MDMIADKKRKIDSQTERQTERDSNRQVGRQTDRQTESGKTGRQTDRKRFTYTGRHTYGGGRDGEGYK